MDTIEYATFRYDIQLKWKVKSRTTCQLSLEMSISVLATLASNIKRTESLYHKLESYLAI